METLPDSAAESALQSARGMHDVLPEQAELYAGLEEKAREWFRVFGYREIRTPVLEPAALFQRTIGENTDIVEKEMFTLEDRGGRVLCLRPEGTAGVARAAIEHSLAQAYARPKFFYIGSMFRAERPQKGRTREFRQIGAECFADPYPSADVEAIAFVPLLLAGYGAEARVLVNSIGCARCRPRYVAKLLEFLRPLSSGLCGHCSTRMEQNPLRVLDCKQDAGRFGAAPTTLDSLCADCAAHFDEVRGELRDVRGIPFEIAPRLVRGLDYYTRTVFEIYPAGRSGSQDALAAGGRYDGLVRQLGGPDIPATGFALGMERVLAAIHPDGAQRAAARRGAFFAPLGDAAYRKCKELVHAFQKAGLAAQAGHPSQSLKSLLRAADRDLVRYCVIVGDDELKAGAASVKDLQAQSQEKIAFAGLAERLKEGSR